MTKFFSPSTSFKSVSIGELDEFMRWKMNIQLGGEGDFLQLRRAVPWLYRGIDIIAQAVKDFPFEIQTESGEPVDTSADWQNKLEFTDDIFNLLYRVSASLTGRGKAYVLPERNRIAVKSLKYFNPDTITPEIDAKAGLEKFVRRVETLQFSYAPDELIYFWLPDDTVELGAPLSYPAQAALNAAGVLFSLDEFFKQHAKSGLIKAFIASAKGIPTTITKDGTDERGRIESYLSKLFAGIKNAGKIRVFNADTFTVTPVGEGFKDMQNVGLTQEKREDISVALGIPVTILWSSQAGGLGGAGVSTEDTRKFYKQTVVPHFNFIADAFNRQLLKSLGYKMVGLPETLDVFQEDDVARSNAVASYTNAIAADPAIAKFVMRNVAKVDLDAKAEAELDALIAETQARKEQVAQAQAAALEQARAQREQGAGNASNGNAPVDDEDDDEDDEQDATKSMERMIERALDKADERGKFKRFAEKHPDQLGAFTFHYLDADEQVALKAVVNGGAASETAQDPFPNTRELKSAPLPDAETRAAAEAALRSKIAKLLKAEQDAAIEKILAGQSVDLAEFENKIRTLIENELTATTETEIARTAAAVGFEFDNPEYNNAAREWARRYSYDLVRNLTDRTREVVRDAVTKFVETPGLTKGDLLDMLVSAFGADRADKIAISETTRAFGQAQFVYKDMLADEGISMEAIWRTLSDGIVCIVCRGLNGVVANDDNTFTHPETGKRYSNPAHVGCRCPIGLRLKRNANSNG